MGWASGFLSKNIGAVCQHIRGSGVCVDPHPHPSTRRSLNCHRVATFHIRATKSTKVIVIASDINRVG